MSACTPKILSAGLPVQWRDYVHEVAYARFANTVHLCSWYYIIFHIWRQRHRGCRGHIPSNIWSAGDEMSYIALKFVKIVIKLPAELMRTVQPAFALQARHRDSPRECDRPSHYLHELWRHSLHIFSLCLHVGINARWVSVTYFLLGQLVPQMCDNRWRRCYLLYY